MATDIATTTAAAPAPAADTDTAVMITGYLPKEVTDSKHKSARRASIFLRSVIKNTKTGKIKRLEVMMGNIFITLKDETGVQELKTALQGLDGVDVTTPSEGRLVFIQERDRVMAKSITEDAAKKDAQTKHVA